MAKNSWTWWNRTRNKENPGGNERGALIGGIIGGPIGGYIGSRWNEKKRKEKERAEASKMLTDLKQNVLAKEIEEGRVKTEEEFNKLIKEFPEYQKDQKLIDELRGTVKEIEAGNLNAYNEYKQTIGKSQAELGRGETETRKGYEKALGIYRNLAKRNTLPGQSAIEDRIGESTASALSNIKKYGGGRGLSALTDIYRSEQDQKRELGLLASQNKQNMQMNLAGTESEYGNIMGNLIRENAVTSSNLGSSLYGAYTDYLTRKMGNQAAIYGAETDENYKEYQSKTIAPQLQAGFVQNKYFENNPFQYKAGLLDRDYQEAYVDKQNAENDIRANNKALIDLLTSGVGLGASLLSGGGSSLLSGGMSNFSGIMGGNKGAYTPTFIPSWHTDPNKNKIEAPQLFKLPE